MMDRYFCEASAKATGDQSSEIATTASMEPIISLVCFIFIATEIYLASTAYSYMRKRQQQLQRTAGRASNNSNNNSNNTELSTIPTPLMVVQEEEDDFLNQVGYLPSIPEDPPDRDNNEEGQT
jgi:hypothetical protein